MANTPSNAARKQAIGKSLQLRAERIDSLPENLEAKVFVDNVPCELMNISETGLAFRIAEFQHAPGHRFRLQIQLDTENRLYDGEAVTIWVRQDEGSMRVGASFASLVLPQDLPKALLALAQIKQKANVELNKAQTLPEQYKAFVLEFKVYLHTLKTSLDELERGLLPLSQEVKESHRKAVESWLGPKIIKKIHDFNVRLGQLIQNFNSPFERKAASELFKAELNPYLIVSPFTERAFLKPLGYAGDYEMMNQIYRNEYEGPSLYSQIIHKYATNEASSLSVRYRKEFLLDRLNEFIEAKEGNIVVASLACGPAMEVIEFLQTAPPELIKRVSFLLMDQDVEALLNVKKNVQRVVLERGIEIRATYTPVSVRDILQVTEEVQGIRDLNIDFLYSAGLYDYLSQPLARALTAELCSLVRSGGRITIANFHPSNPTKAISEFSADWRLIHRTEEQLMELVPEAYAKHASVSSDDQKIELFLTIEIR